LKVTDSKISFLFMGDASTLVENDLIAKGVSLKANVLKVGHHGSATSTGSTFLTKVAPKYAVIEVGKGNPYGHPTAAALARLKAAKVTTYRTDLDGTVVFTTDGTTLSVSKKPATAASVVAAPKTQTSANVTVYITSSGTKYHRLGCRYLSSSCIAISRSDAIVKGYTPCSTCSPP
jgi:competence protein ComEC